MKYVPKNTWIRPFHVYLCISYTALRSRILNSYIVKGTTPETEYL